MSISSTDQGRATDAAARLLAALAVGASLLALALPALGGYDYLEDLVSSPDAVIGVSFSAVAGFLVGRGTPRAVPLTMLGVGVSAATYTLSTSVAAFLLRGDAASVPDRAEDVVTWTAWLSSWTWFPAYLVVLTVLPHLLPDGRVRGRLRQVPVAAALAILLLVGLQLATEPGPLSNAPAVDNPVGSTVLQRALGPLVQTLDLVVLVLAAVALVSVAGSLASAPPAQRRQLGWVGYSIGIAVAVAVVSPLLALPAWVVNLAVALVPIGIAVSVLRYRLWDLDLLVNRTLVAALLVGSAYVAYAVVVGWLGALLDTGRDVTSFLAAFTVALAFHPARIYVQRGVDRLLFGRRGDPYALLREVDGALHDADNPRRALDDAVARVQAGLRLTGVEVSVPMPSGEVVRARAGAVRGPGTSLPLQLHGQRVGELRVGARRRDTHLTGRDQHVLTALCGPLASAAYALRLSGDLAGAHGRLIAAREEERRRLRRDLHDGLGPQLAGVTMGLDSVRSALRRGDTDRADVLAVEVGGRARAALDDVRRLVSGLRPPVLDALGLAGALQAAIPSGPTDAGPVVTVTSEGNLASLPAAVEVAAFRIASEAISNAVRHADAERVEVRLEADGRALTISVADDGRGIAEPAGQGVGMSSMRERASELGGDYDVTCRHPGTVVTVRLPVTSVAELT